jgi:hypothetical protein
MAKGVGAICCVYEDDAWLPTMVEGCYAAVDKLYFLVSSRPWKGEPGDNEKTIQAIRSCSDPDDKLMIAEGDWSVEADQRNAGLDLCRRDGLELCVIIDADEIYDPATLCFLLEMARLQRRASVWSISQVTYWKSYRYKIDGTGHNGQNAIVRLGDVRFKTIRNTTASETTLIPSQFGVCHHLSYARTNEEIIKKLAHFSHAHQICPGWLDGVWHRWDREPTLQNLHPVRPNLFPRAVLQQPDAYPPALRQIYERERATHSTVDLPE